MSEPHPIRSVDFSVKSGTRSINFALLCAAMALVYFSSACSTCGAAYPTGEVVCEIARDGDLPIVAAEVGGKKLRLLVDTGLTISALDVRHRNLAGELQGTAELQDTDGRHVDLEVRAAPEIRVGGRRLPIDVIVLMDVRQFEFTGEAYDGCIGLDILKHFVAEFDFDAGQFRLFKQAPSDLGIAFDLMQTIDGFPAIDVRIGTEAPMRVSLCTGKSAALGLSKTAFLELSNNAQLRGFDRLSLELVARRRDSIPGVVSQLQIGRFSHRDILAWTASDNTLGLGYLSRYKCTFDFPKQKLYLKPGAAFHGVDRFDRSGLYITKSSGRFTVSHVYPISPAAEAGLIEYDVIKAIDGKSC
ncbi:MAG: hypothetical protein JSS02_26490, partial [Planctomycetes bacterium]|nr:hypothetical protein [Planctomycetota bacterium]